MNMFIFHAEILMAKIDAIAWLGLEPRTPGLSCL